MDLFGFIVYVIQILSWCPLLPNLASAGAKVGSWNQNLGSWRVPSSLQKIGRLFAYRFLSFKMTDFELRNEGRLESDYTEYKYY